MECAGGEQLANLYGDPGLQVRGAGPKFVHQGLPVIDDADQVAEVMAEEVVGLAITAFWHAPAQAPRSPSFTSRRSQSSCPKWSKDRLCAFSAACGRRSERNCNWNSKRGRKSLSFALKDVRHRPSQRPCLAPTPSKRPRHAPATMATASGQPDIRHKPNGHLLTVLTL